MMYRERNFNRPDFYYENVVSRKQIEMYPCLQFMMRRKNHINNHTVVFILANLLLFVRAMFKDPLTLVFLL